MKKELQHGDQFEWHNKKMTVIDNNRITNTITVHDEQEDEEKTMGFWEFIEGVQ